MTTAANASQILSDEDHAAAIKMICGGFPRNGFVGFNNGTLASTAKKHLLRSLLSTSTIDAETIRIIRGYFNEQRGSGRGISAYEVSCAIRILSGEVPQDMVAIARAAADAELAIRTEEARIAIRKALEI